MATNQNRPIPHLTPRQIARFRKNILVGDLNECWPWINTIDKGGYGRYATFLSHRISYFLMTGIEPGDFVVCHSCDNRRCQNGNHLFLGTIADNVADMFAKNRAPRARGDAHYMRLHPEKIPRGDSHYMHLHPEKVPQGPDRHNAKLTWEQVREIREIHKPYNRGPNGVTLKYNVSRETIYSILRGDKWKCLI